MNTPTNNNNPTDNLPTNNLPTPTQKLFIDNIHQKSMLAIAITFITWAVATTILTINSSNYKYKKIWLILTTILGTIGTILIIIQAVIF